MGFFKKSAEEVMPTAEELNKIRVKVLGAYAMCEVFDAEIAKDGVSLRAAAQKDLERFAIFVADADSQVDQKELDAVNSMLGTSLAAEDCAELLVGKVELGYYGEMPESFVILRDYYDTGLDMTIADCLYEIYEDLGAIMSRADGTIDRDEKWEINSFLALLRRYAVRD